MHCYAAVLNVPNKVVSKLVKGTWYLVSKYCVIFISISIVANECTNA